MKIINLQGACHHHRSQLARTGRSRYSDMPSLTALGTESVRLLPAHKTWADLLCASLLGIFDLQSNLHMEGLPAAIFDPSLTGQTNSSTQRQP